MSDDDGLRRAYNKITIKLADVEVERTRARDLLDNYTNGYYLGVVYGLAQSRQIVRTQIEKRDVGKNQILNI